MEGERSFYRGGNFNGGIMVMLQKRSLYWRGNGYTEVEGEWSCYRGGVNGGSMVIQRSVQWRENSHVTEVASLNEGEWSCYGGCH